MPAVTQIGLDIGSTSVRAAQTSPGRDGLAVTGFGHAPLPPGAVRSGVIHDDRAVTGAIKQLFATHKFAGRNVVLGVTNPQLVVREMSVTNLPPREMRKALPFQVRDTLPLPVERSLLDFYPLEEPGTNEMVRGLLIAAPKEAVLTAVQATERAGLHVSRVDLASFALLRAASRLDETVEALVDIGAHQTTVVVHNDGYPLIVRTVPRGGAEVTETIASRLTIPLPEAETRKCQIGLRADREAETAEAVRDAVRPLINEIRSSFAYLNTGDRVARVNRLALSGGGALLPGLVDLLTAQLNVEAVIADPTARLTGTRRVRAQGLDDIRSSATVSLGLALGVAA